MLDTQELQIAAQLIDNMELLTKRIESSFTANDAEEFNRSKEEILNHQKKISDMLKK
jgi:hypothetical protein